jgi:hypothetical protein
VKCATQNKIIKAWEVMQAELGEPTNSMSTPVFCKSHQVEGINIFKQQGEAGLIRQPNRRNFTLKITNVPKLKKTIQK